jgi:3-keto-disaccharide hydrolase
MRVSSSLTFAASLLVLPAMAMAQNPNPIPKDPSPWPQHSLKRPQPPIVTPAPASAPVPPPSDAIVLFDGTSLAQWRSVDTTAGPAKWTVRDGYMEVDPRAGDIETRQGFGDAQYHIEWMAPTPPTGTGQGRGNSGVYIMGLYETQVLDSYHNTTYPDGQAAAIYGEFPPLVNASRPPGQWQTYDIIFHAPRFDATGRVTRPARETVFHNGVLVQDNTVLIGPTANGTRPPYKAHPSRLPLRLQDHGDKVRYRDIWVRELSDSMP